MKTTTIRGSGGRMHAVEQAASLRHLADELRNDRDKMKINEITFMEVTIRRVRLQESASIIEAEILAYDLRSRGALTPGEQDSGVKRQP